MQDIPTLRQRATGRDVIDDDSLAAMLAILSTDLPTLARQVITHTGEDADKLRVMILLGATIGLVEVRWSYIDPTIDDAPIDTPSAPTDESITALCDLLARAMADLSDQLIQGTVTRDACELVTATWTKVRPALDLMMEAHRNPARSSPWKH